MDSKIRNQIIEWVSKHLGDSFVFRKHQLETIEDIISNIVNKVHHTHIIEAPTGSGKSLLCIISAGVLAEYYDMKSYILCSDLYLYSQYEDFIRINKLDFGALKGQTGNYYCDKNGEDMRNAECRIAKLSWSKMYRYKDVEQLGFGCARYCTYLTARKKAQNAKVTLMTYQLYFYMINIVKNQVEKAPFTNRDVIFCDECHNIPSLVQSQYSPTIRLSDLDKLINIYQYNMRLQGGLFDNEESCPRLPWNSINDLRKQFVDLWDVFSNENESKDFKSIFEYIDMIKKFSITVEHLEDALATKKRSGLRFTKKDIEMYKVSSWYRNYCCFLNDFSTAISDCGPEYLVKTHNIPNNDKGELTISFNCAKEDYMCWKYLLSTANNNVLMSATVGMKEAFDDNIGMKFSEEEQSYMQRIPSTFDFSKSPIIINTRYKMSYSCKEFTFPKIREMIYYIVRQYKDFRGMIQTGSYANAKDIYDNAPYDIKQRFQLYNNSSEKHWTIEMHKALDNSVIIGPTLVEGIDLPDDLCRFIIIAKVPYPNLKDKLVTAKMKLFSQWYDSETANSIIQGIGRGNRHPKDWCVTYILDGCFENLFNKTISQFPMELRLRMQVTR